jgi:uncharacterized membrane protein YecN with MAPEG domain
MVLQVTALYAALLGLIGIVLAGMVGQARGKAKIAVNDGGDRRIIIANRRHLNWVEYVPYIVILLAIIELNGGSKTWLHVMGGALLVSRLVHPFGIDPDKMDTPARIIGAGLTFLVWLAASVTLLWQLFMR